jgi:serine/threonine-protein kinase RsbT
LAAEAEFTDYETTKLVTAASEVSRNILNYAETGHAEVDFRTDDQPEIQIFFEDEGPGIDDVDRALEDGFSGEKSDGLGVGLPGAKRLADQFSIDSSSDGTRVTIVVRKDQQR